MQNVITSVTGAVCAVADTLANTADAVNGLSEAARIRSESFARITQLRVDHQEKEITFELELQSKQLAILMADPVKMAAAVKAKATAEAKTRKPRRKNVAKAA